MYEFAISAGEGTLLQHGVAAFSTIEKKIKALDVLGEQGYSLVVAPISYRVLDAQYRAPEGQGFAPRLYDQFNG